MIEIDGSRGEGGGQVVRTAVSLAAATETSVRVTDVRAARSNPGLRPQHRTAVETCAAICGAELENVTTGAQTFEFRDPGPARPAEGSWSVGTAGSGTLVLQTLVPPLLRADGPSEVVIEGGSHTMKAPIWEHFERSYLAVLERMGIASEAKLERHGFYPAGGGRMCLRLDPTGPPLEAVELSGRGSLRELEVTAILADLPGHIARRELETFADELPVYEFTRRVDAVDSADSPGNALYAAIESDAATIILSEMGRKGRPAEEVARRLAERVRRFLESDAAVDPHLADQLLVPLALAGRGRFSASEITAHCRTQLELIPEFLDVAFDVDETADGAVQIEVRSE